MKLTKLTGILLVSSSLLFQSALQAENFRARIVKVQGEVYVVNSEGDKREPEKKQFLVNSNETVVTSKESRAVIQFEDGAMSVLDEKSSLRVEQSGWLSQLGGKIYYVFRKVIGKKKPKKVRTRFATIGIRGTTFIVDAEEASQQVALQEGKLNLESPGDDYEIHKAVSDTQDFAAFKQQAAQRQQELDDEFSDYKQNIGEEFIEYKKSFDLEANKVVSFNGNRVDENTLDKNWESSFDDFAEFSKDYIDAYKEFEQSSQSDSIN
ncbi:MAG: FecR domain-containing protein [Gammaproteobacteria bacterium]|nr:FecR domain-containing protein [Gammaproteobacteria bacterium]